MVLGNTPQKSPSTSKSSLQEPADLQEYSRSAQKRRRLSFGQSPVTPAKAENNPGAPAHSDHRPESPTLDLCHDGENFEADFELRPSTEIKVLQRELKLIKQQLKSTKQANAQAEAEKEQADKEICQLREQIAHLTGANIENCDEEELHQLGKVLTYAQGRLAVERTRQSASKQLKRRLRAWEPTNNDSA